MKIATNHSGEYRDVINSHYDLKRFDDGSDSEVLFQGYNSSRDNVLKAAYKDYKKRAYLNLEAPCSFTTTPTSIEEQMYFTDVYSICPYTCDWLNAKGSTVFTPIPFPYSKTTSVVSEYKAIDVIYMGTLMGPMYNEMIEVLRGFNYVHVALQRSKRSYKPTHLKISSTKKLKLLSQSKVSVAMNLAPVSQGHVNMIMGYSGWRENEAFSDLGDGYFPQFKPRVIESMMCKTLVLVKKDRWNVIEGWFDPGMHFLYWDDMVDLSDTITDVVNNYGDYADIVENAYDLVAEYEIDNIYKNVINND